MLLQSVFGRLAGYEDVNAGDGESADPRGRGPPSPLSRAQGAEGERVRHVNRVKGLLFSQGISGYQPLRHDRRERLDTLQTGDGCLLPDHLKAQVRRELDRLELLLKQIKAVEAERDTLLAVQQGAAPAPAAMLLNIKGIGPEFAGILWSEGLFRHFDNRRQVASYAGLAPTPWQKIGRSRTGRV
jgi:transposase